MSKETISISTNRLNHVRVLACTEAPCEKYVKFQDGSPLCKNCPFFDLANFEVWLDNG